MNHHQLKTGGDPRALPDYATLRDELAKLSHPARPDVDWRRAEQLSLSLFRQNGIELQTLSWYTLARTHLAGMSGLNEGLALLVALLNHQWSTMWPQAVHARIEILAGLSQRLQSVLRRRLLRYADLPQIYQAEQHLTTLRDLLKQLELKHASQIDALCLFMRNAATRIESSNGEDAKQTGVVLTASAAAFNLAASGTSDKPLVYVAEAKPALNMLTAPAVLPYQRSPWRAFSAGMLTTLLLVAVALWVWRENAPLKESVIPEIASEAALRQLGQLPPLWRQEYGFALAAKAKPEEAGRLQAQWRHYIHGNALPSEALSGWH